MEEKNEKNKRIYINAYNNAWNVEKKIYAIQNFRLPVPVSLIEAVYFVLIVAIIVILGTIFKGFTKIPSILRFIVLPYFLTKFLVRKKLDGKSPQKYFITWLKYVIKKNIYIERFSEVNKTKDDKIKIDWQCSRGNSRVLFPRKTD